MVSGSAPDVHSREINANELFLSEHIEMARMPGLLLGRDCFVDVGANVGHYTHSASQILKDADIIAVEADPTIAAALRERALVWAEESGNRITVINAAVMDRPGEVRFARTGDSTTGHVSAKGAADTVAVRATTLDDIVPTGRRPLVKIDIEGAEHRAIMGATRLLADGCSTFLMELHGWGDAELRRYPLHLVREMRRHGFSMRRIGTHFYFDRSDTVAPAAERLVTACVLWAKYILHTQIPALRPLVRSIARRGLIPRM